ncbi:hypothetical protein WA588_000443 [Blastocystis sp. NMH]
MALMSLAPVVFVVIICASVLVNRDMHSCFLLAEMLSCTALNQILKHIIKQERPGGAQHTHGMPSDHAQFMSCLCVYLTLWLYNRVHLSSFVQNQIAIVALWVTWGCVIYGRLYLGEHTVAQVIVGITVGCAYGLGWYSLDISVFRSYYHSISQWPLFRWLQFKDYSNVINPLEKERLLSEESTSKKD